MQDQICSSECESGSSSHAQGRYGLEQDNHRPARPSACAKSKSTSQHSVCTSGDNRWGSSHEPTWPGRDQVCSSASESSCSSACSSKDPVVCSSRSWSQQDPVQTPKASKQKDTRVCAHPASASQTATLPLCHAAIVTSLPAPQAEHIRVIDFRSTCAAHPLCSTRRWSAADLSKKVRHVRVGSLTMKLMYGSSVLVGFGGALFFFDQSSRRAQSSMSVLLTRNVGMEVPLSHFGWRVLL